MKRALLAALLLTSMAAGCPADIFVAACDEFRGWDGADLSVRVVWASGGTVARACVRAMPTQASDRDDHRSREARTDGRGLVELRLPAGMEWHLSASVETPGDPYCAWYEYGPNVTIEKATDVRLTIDKRTTVCS